ncbi:hypothetical protein EXS65_00340 [Candidatus Peribacteria bacterium]|nr:hypothetical protein [Candidatus Peribacteria bacterium]
MTFQHTRERLTLLLLALLPFHAFLVTVLTRVIAGPGHAPLPELAVWKEAILGLILILAFVELVKKRTIPVADVIDCIILSLGFVALALRLMHHQSATVFAFGFKYDLLPLIAFILLRRVNWSDEFHTTLLRLLLLVGCIVAAYGIVAEFLPLRFFVWLGYSDLHSLYVANGPLAAFQELEGGMMRRAQSSMSGPNQLGLWLLIPLGVLLGGKNVGEEMSGKRIAIGVLLLLALMLSFSRAAWIAAAVMIIFAFARSTSALHCRKLYVVILGFLACFGIAVTLLFPSVFFRFQSSSDHIRKPVEAIRIMMDHPFGLGLGTAGPASNRFSDTCVKLPKDSDWSWAKDRQDLCVFVDGNQVQPSLPSGELRPAGQPSARACSCPLLTENWYLQIGVELGWIGLILSLLLPIFILRQLIIENGKLKINVELSIINYQLSIFLGLSLAALFLHAFEDSAVAYTVWVLLASAFATLHPCHRLLSRSQGPSSSSTSADSTRI